MVMFLSVLGSSFLLYQSFLLPWSPDSSIARSDWNLLLPLWVFEPGESVCFRLSWIPWVQHPRSWSCFRTNKSVHSCLDNFESPHIRYKLTCPRMQHCCKPWMIKIARWELIEVSVFWHWKLKNDSGQGNCCFYILLCW